jgi:hypothetical protein
MTARMSPASPDKDFALRHYLGMALDDANEHLEAAKSNLEIAAYRLEHSTAMTEYGILDAEAEAEYDFCRNRYYHWLSRRDYLSQQYSSALRAAI